MKHTNMMRKALPALLAAVLAVPSPAASAGRGRNDGGQFEREVEACFHRRMTHGTLADVASRPLARRKIAAARAAVWQTWQRTLREASPLPLPALRPLGEASQGSWTLPDSLEPSATMAFYYGTKGQRPAGGYPFYLYLHGSGPRAAEWATGLQLALRFDDAPSVYFVPRIPNEGAYYRWWQRAKLYAWRHLLWQVLASDSVNPARLYVLGISEGGYGSQRLAAFLGDYWAAAGPMAGGEPLPNAPAVNLAGVPFSLLTGADDAGFCRNRLTAEAGRVLDSLRTAHPGSYEHRVELIPGRGHGIDYSPTTPWLKRYERNARPAYFAWEDYAMDGCRREGFGCLRVVRRPSGEADARTCYEVTLRGNSVDLRISNVSYTTAEADTQWGIPLRSARTLTPATGGELLLYLDEEQVDVRRDVVVRVNGREAFRGRVRPDACHLAESCALWGDPLRLYALAVRVTY